MLGAVAVHGYAGFIGVIVAGFMLWGYPATAAADSALITPLGQLKGALVLYLVFYQDSF